jgi:hypothetical protein
VSAIRISLSHTGRQKTTDEMGAMLTPAKTEENGILAASKYPASSASAFLQFRSLTSEN